MITEDKIKEILQENKKFKLEYFDKNEYVIDSFIQDYEIIFYVYDSALGTAKLQGQPTNKLKNLVSELEKCEAKSILTVSISSLKKEGNHLAILIEPSSEKVIGVHSKLNL